MEHQTLGQWVAWPINPATHRIVLKIDWFVVTVGVQKINNNIVIGQSYKYHDGGDNEHSV